MSRTLSTDAIVLRTFDIGEADRFCVLFTRLHGRRAARAKAVRKPLSRLGSLLLPFRMLTVELVESDHSCVITGAVSSEAMDPPSAFPVVLELQQGIELLLSLTEDDEPLPAVFDLVSQFIRVAADGSSQASALLPFQLRLLHLLGLLPAVADDLRFQKLHAAARLFVESCATMHDLRSLATLPCPSSIHSFLLNVLSEQLSAPLRSAMVAGAM